MVTLNASYLKNGTWACPSGDIATWQSSNYSNYRGWSVEGGYDIYYNGTFWHSWGNVYIDSDLNGILDTSIDELIGITYVQYGSEYGSGEWTRTPDMSYGNFNGSAYGMFEVTADLVFNTTENNDSIIASTNSDVIESLGGDDVIDARGGSDLIIAGEGNDTMYGGSGNDTLYGGEGSNTYTGGSGDDFAVFNFARSSTTSISSTSVTTSTQTETLSGIEGKAFLEVNHDGSFVAGQAGFQDIDGDGKTDLIFQNNTLDFYVSSGSSTGLGSTSLSFEHGGTPGFTRDQMQFADINGDGYSDAIWQGNDNQFWANFGGNSGFGGSSLVNTHGGAFDPDKVQYVDVTGDGAEDLIFHGDDNRFWLSQSNGTNFDNPIHAATHGGPTNFASVQYADVDGDGKKDMIYHGVDNRFWISKSNGTTFGGAYFANQHGGAFDTTKVQYADIDGDGKDDMFYQGDDNRIWVAKSNGTKFVNNTLAASVTHDDFDTDQVSFFDMNGDDKADMVYQGDGNEVWYYQSNGSTFNTADQIADFSGSFTEGSLGLGDIDGDGNGDLFYQDSSNDFYIALNSDFM